MSRTKPLPKSKLTTGATEKEKALKKGSKLTAHCSRASSSLLVWVKSDLTFRHCWKQDSYSFSTYHHIHVFIMLSSWFPIQFVVDWCPVAKYLFWVYHQRSH